MYRVGLPAVPGAYSNWRDLEIFGRGRDRGVRPEGHERCDQNPTATISSGCSGSRHPTATRSYRRRCHNNLRCLVITARIVGGDAVLAWLHETPDAVASGLARAISKLGIDLQRK